MPPNYYTTIYINEYSADATTYIYRRQASINFKTAKTLSLTIPSGVLAIADEVIG
jgi:hypothetical protein